MTKKRLSREEKGKDPAPQEQPKKKKRQQRQEEADRAFAEALERGEDPHKGSLQLEPRRMTARQRAIAEAAAAARRPPPRPQTRTVTERVHNHDDDGTFHNDCPLCDDQRSETVSRLLRRAMASAEDLLNMDGPALKRLRLVPFEQWAPDTREDDRFFTDLQRRLFETYRRRYTWTRSQADHARVDFAQLDSAAGTPVSQHFRVIPGLEELMTAELR
jgi:hypothetical protein